MKKYCPSKKIHRLLLSLLLSLICLLGYAESSTTPTPTNVEKNNKHSRVTITGTVKDANGPLEGVTVQEKSGSGAAISGVKGFYSISVVDANAVLVFSAIGYETKEVAIAGRSVVNVELTQAVKELSDVIVTALGITRDKKSLGYSVAEIDGKEMNRVAQENVLNSMSGKVPGVTINQTGGAGSSVSIVIRGANSLSNDNQPLFVVDGVPISNSLNNVSQVGNDNRVDFGNAISSINPDDIASVTILKGPSAAALYGSRAGNGVVLITTKSGKGVNRMTVTITSSTVFDKPYRFLDWQTKYGSGQFSAIPIEISGNILTDPFGGLIQENVGGTGGGELDRGYKAVQWNSPLDSNGKKIPLPLVSHPNNARDFVQTGITSTNGISMANSNDFMNYRLSYSNMTNKGIIPGSDLFRNTFDVAASLKVNDKLRISTNIDLSRNNSNNRPASERGANPLQWMYAVSPHIDINDLRDYWEPGKVGLQQRTPYNGVFENPFFLAYEIDNGFVRDRMYGNIRADWQILKKLSLIVRYGLDNLTEQREFKIANSYTKDPRGAYGLIGIKSFESNADFLLTYKNKFDAFGLSLSAGGNSRFQKGSTLRNATKNGTGLIVPGIYTIQNILPASLDYNSYSYKKGINSLYGTASFDFKEMVFLDVTGRNDWSSTLPNAAPYFYPSTSISLLVNQMLGLTSSRINLIKLRAGVAQVGNDTDPYQLLSVLGNYGTWGDIPRLSTSGTLLNPDLKPEIATSYEGGIDVNLFKNRLNFSATYYQVDNRNQIFTTSLTSSTGYTSKKINAGLLRSKGIELSLGGTPVLTNDFRWDLNVNFSRNRTTVMELANEMPYFTFWEDAKGGAWTYLGEEVGDIYGPQVKTVTDKSSKYYGWPLLIEEDGGAKWDAVSAKNTRNKIGNFNPKFLMGLQTSFSYKNWNLSMSFDWRNGGQFVSQTYRYGTEDYRSSLQFKQFVDAGSRSGKELRDWLVENADKYIIVKDGNFPRVGWPTPEHTSYPFEFSGIKLPYGGVFIPGVYATGYDAQGNPTGYAENLGENVLGADPNNPNATRPLPYAASNPWDFMQPSMFSASYIKLREISLGFGLPQKLANSLRLQNASISVYSRNIILWTKAKIGIDPENAFQVSSDLQGGGIQFKQGIERYNVTPWVLPIGIKLNVTF
ncbi:MAG TPA: SusC/RagA family TonB-linked outer membrane protein [Niabella sp.]|nr:SusC/RagA family TonB-linked outer membrane protein [Niabella sp.]HOZ95741.1 SusC/RagA family TonB-linked outer membrane protein [Niabella sp.]HQW15984.1 SusC/RagA family TonB-linked outer membrane protein [Niabella sp.]HQX21163.1 SusC/RagA family TonB-linked outer membrane protein [Niabella sp.]HQX40746.1 SusC/RagA family TonB-linked outer membrane protein [Niabella sp.]